MIHIQMSRMFFECEPQGGVSRLALVARQIKDVGELMVRLHLESELEPSELAVIADVFANWQGDVSLMLSHRSVIPEALTVAPFTVVWPIALLETLSEEARRLGVQRGRVAAWVPIPVSGWNPDDTWTRLDALQPGASLELAVGWQHPLSGPEPIAETNYSALSAQLLSFVQAASTRKIACRFACGLPLCLFSTQQLGQLVGYKLDWPLARCGNQWVVGPDGGIDFCMRLPLESKMSGWQKGGFTFSRIDAVQAFGETRTTCVAPGITGCRSQRTSACAGGCLAHTISSTGTI